jgi:hypothetical protein
MDSVFCVSPRNYAASLFLSASTALSLGLPTINLLSRCDAAPARYIARIFRWHSSEDSFDIPVSGSVNELQASLTREIVQSVWYIASSIPLIAVSSKNLEGFTELFGTLTRMCGEGEMELR